MPESNPEIRGRPVFRPVILAVMLVLLGVYLAIHIGMLSEEFKPALNQSKPPLADQAIILEPAPAALARRVVIVVVDGLRLADSYRLPNLDRLRRRGIDTSATSHYPSFSRPNHVTIVTGVPPEASGVRTNDYNAEVALDSLMDRVKDAGQRAAFAADYTNGLPVMFTRHARTPGGGDDYESAFYDATMANWPGGLELVSVRLLQMDYSLVIAIAGAVDDAGHEYGGDSPEYRDAAARVDAMLGRVLEDFDFESDALIVTADHGHTDDGGHGGLEPDVMEVPLIMAGAGIRTGAAVVAAELIDVAPTAAALLGLPAPAHGLGRALTDGLHISDASSRALNQASSKRVERNRNTVVAWHEVGSKHMKRARFWRIPLVLALFGLGVMIIVAAKRKHAVDIDWRVLFIALPAFPASYYALLAVFGQQFSPSFVPDRGSLVAVLFRFGLVSTAAHIVVSWFAFRGRVVLAERLATANGLFLIGLLGSITALGAVWAIWPEPFISVPSPSLVVLIPATYVACACYGLAVVATLSLEIVVFFARAVDPRILREKRRLPRRRTM